MLYFIPIEPLEERYSAQWLFWFEDAFINHSVKYHIILGNAYTQIENGAFLDVIKTNKWKSEQMVQICSLFEKGQVTQEDTFFFMDGWNPCVEMLAYIRDGLNIKFKIAGIFHAGSYDPNDRLAIWGTEGWAYSAENSWFNIYDKIFVATDYHRRLILETRVADASKIEVTGLPFYPDALGFTIDECPYDNKRSIVVFPHRLDAEKQPEIFDLVSKELEMSQLHFIKTMEILKNIQPVFLRKSFYYEILKKSLVAFSSAKQETWGIAMMESLFCGCIPLVPNRLSYLELYHSDLFYEKNSITAISNKILDMVNHPKNYEQAVTWTKNHIQQIGESAIPKMLHYLMLI